MVSASTSVLFGHAQRVAAEITVHVEPGVAVLAGYFDNQRVALPPAA
jgi:hypothetical protein